MAYEQRDNSGSLWVNDRKEKDNHPDRTGTVMVGGVEYWISGWIKEKNGKKWLSLAFKEKDGGGNNAQPVAAGAGEEVDDNF